MPTRGNKERQFKPIRERIQQGVLMNLLHRNAIGEVDLSPGRIKSIEILLKKCLPDISAIEHRGDGGGPMLVEIVKFGDSKD